MEILNTHGLFLMLLPEVSPTSKNSISILCDWCIGKLDPFWRNQEFNGVQLCYKATWQPEIWRQQWREIWLWYDVMLWKYFPFSKIGCYINIYIYLYIYGISIICKEKKHVERLWQIYPPVVNPAGFCGRSSGRAESGGCINHPRMVALWHWVYHVRYHRWS